MEPLLMMRPPRGCWLFMILIASWVQTKEPVRLVSTTAFHFSKGSSSMGTGGAPMPALLKRRSSRPKVSLVLAKRARMDSGSPTSVTSATLVAVAMGSCPPCLLLAVDVEPDFFLTVGYGDVSFGRGDDGGLAGRRWSEFLRQVHGDGQDVSCDGHLHVLHGSPPADSLAQNRAPRLAR